MKYKDDSVKKKNGIQIAQSYFKYLGVSIIDIKVSQNYIYLQEHTLFKERNFQKKNNFCNKT